MQYKYYIIKTVSLTLCLIAASIYTGCGQSLSPFNRSRPVTYVRDAVSKKPIGKYRISITYRFAVDMNAFDTAACYITDYDFTKLEINADNGLSRYYSLAADRCDSIMYEARTDGKENYTGVDVTGWMRDGRVAIYDDYYQNWPERGLLTVRLGILNTEYEYTEALPTMKWDLIIGNERNICGYACNCASTFFRGRCYTVWYCLDIPVNAGPWKFSGLPGLIMAVEESTGVFSWEAVGIDADYGDIYIHDPEYDCIENHVQCGVPKADIRKISRSQALKLEKRRWADPWGFALDKGIMVLLRVNENSRETVEATSANREQFALPEVPALELE